MDDITDPGNNEYPRRERCCPPHISELYRNWFTVVALFVGAVWALYNFWFKEFFQPKQVPVNISLSLELQKETATSQAASLVAGDQAPGGLVAVELSVKATNPSSRTVYLLPSAWVARGYTVQATDTRKDFPTSAGKNIAENKIRPVEKYVSESNSTAVAAGRVFADTELKPNETITRRIVFHVPPSPYNAVEVFTCIPSTSARQGIGVKWRVRGDELSWQITRDGKPMPDPDPKDDPGDEIQESFARAAMTL